MNLKHIADWGVCAAGSLLAVSMAGIAAAADTPQPAESDSNTIAEIIVTAQRRSEKSQDVPISINAVSADKLESSGVNTIADLPVAVPSLSVANGNGYLITHLRGIGGITNGPGIENSVALYVDNVYYGSQSVGIFGLDNIAQVEVLKGPQGTLFGRNATGGLIQVITQDPTQEFKLKTTVGASNFRGFEGNAYVAGGLAPNLVADVAVSAYRRDGWGVNEFYDKDIYSVKHDLSVRSKWIYTPTENLKFTLIADVTNRLSTTDVLTVPEGTYAIRGLTPPATYRSFWNANTNVQPEILQRNGGISFKTDYDFVAFTVSNIAAYRKTRSDNLFDYDASPLPLAGIRVEQNENYQYSEELQFTSRSTGPLKWVAGVYYFRGDAEITPNTVTLSDQPALNPNFPVTKLFIFGDTRTESVSGYSQATYAINDKFDVTAGARYSYEHRDLVGSESASLSVPGNPQITIFPKTYLGGQVFKDPTYRLAFTYKPDSDVLLYASWNTGFKSGGFNTTTPTDPPFKPEKLQAYEVGEKAEFLDHSLRLNSAFFFYDYKDIQVQLPEAVGTGIINGGRAHLYGTDIDVTYIPVHHLELTAGIAFLRAFYTQFPNAPISQPGGGLPVITGSAKSKNLPYAPHATVDLGAAYTVDLNAGALTFDVHYSHNSGFSFEPDNVAQQGAFNQFNAAVRWKSPGDHYSVSLYGNNLSNVEVISARITTPSGQQLKTAAAPRTYGIKFGYQY